MASQPAPHTDFNALTWDTLEHWAGAGVVSRGRTYQRRRHVQGLACTPTGGLVAWVRGTERYATRVDMADGGLAAVCTCPYPGACKHAVAVVLEYLDQVEKQQVIPAVTAQDQRLTALAQHASAARWEDADADDEEFEEDADDEAAEAQFEEEDVAPPPLRQSGRPTAIHTFLEQHTREQLIALLDELAQRYPEVRQTLQDRRDLTVGKATELVRTVRRELTSLRAASQRYDDWDDDEASGPELTRVRERLETLLARGHVDDVIDLGEELLEVGLHQVEMSHDEGELAEDLTACMHVVFRALVQSSRPLAERMLWAVDAALQDEYDLCHGAHVFWDQPFSTIDWHALAEQLSARLQRDRPATGTDSFTHNYRRDRLTNWLIDALDHAGRAAEIIPLCEREAEMTGSYVRLVQRLRQAERRDDAERWIHQGIAATQQAAPGIASQLRTALRDIREQAGDWLYVAAFDAESFFRAPTLASFQALHHTAERANVWPPVRAAAMHYLETGERPAALNRADKSRDVTAWPLPATGVPEVEPRVQMTPPMTATLIDIAIAEQRPADVLRWYDQHRPGPGRFMWGGMADDRIAEAVAGTYPDRAITIWKKLAETEIARTQPSAYEIAVRHLHKVQEVCQRLDRGAEWQGYLTGLRQAHARKRRLMEMLDGLERGRRILRGS